VAVPKRKTTSSKRDMRRANHDKVLPVTSVACPKCGELTLPHRVCPSCGYYKGRKLLVGTADQEKASE
jgi:large subunit ribosomal protein L32